jgi:hypothetical protein
MKRIQLALACLLLLAGCSRLTAENYEQLKIGMPYSEVKELLGAPDDCSDLLAVKNCTWGDAHRNVKVSFVGEQVVVFSATNLR